MYGSNVFKNIKKWCFEKRPPLPGSFFFKHPQNIGFENIQIWEQVTNFKSQVSKLTSLKCDGILIACTELSLLRDYIPMSLPCVDSLDCLVEKIISMAMITEA